jgi:hypothetical protein
LPLTPLSGVRLASKIPPVRTLIAYVPFVVNEASTEPPLSPAFSMYVQKRGVDAEPRLQDVPSIYSTDDYIKMLSDRSKHSGAPLSAMEYIEKNPYVARRDGLSSLWVDPKGGVHVVSPHNHTLSAYGLLQTNLAPQGYEVNSQTLPKSGTDFQDLTHVSGIIRTQVYPDGIGVSIDLDHVPTVDQMRSLLELYTFTTQERFVAELYKGGERVGLVKRPRELEQILFQARSGDLDLSKFAASSYVKFVSGGSTNDNRIA